MDLEPIYVVKLYGVAGMGPEGLYRSADALLRLFRPGKWLLLASGDVVRVRSNPSPTRGMLVPEGDGHSVIVVTIPLWVRTANNTEE